MSKGKVRARVRQFRRWLTGPWRRYWQRIADPVNEERFRKGHW